MNSKKAPYLSSALLALALTYAQPVAATDEFSGREFAGWSIKGQNGYIANAVTMAGFIAGQIDPDFSKCIGDWYFEDPRGQDAKNRNIREVIASVPDYHPGATLLALIQRACGSFKR